MTKRCVANTATLFVLFFLIQCNSTGSKPPFAREPQVTIDLDAIRERGYLVALLDNNSISYFIYKGRPMGYEYELLTRLASHLKVELKIKLVSGIEQSIDLLNKGEGDILAFPLTVTTERTQYLSFTNTHFNTYQVLVQRKPDSVNQQVIKQPAELIGQDVYVMKGSSFKERLTNLSQEVRGDIHIIEDTDSAETESLIRKVSTGEIKYTVTDQTIAKVNSFYYPNLDIGTVLSEPQQIAWGIRKNSPVLLESVNSWLKEVKRTAIYQVIYDKYLNSPRFFSATIAGENSPLQKNSLSPFDKQLKEGAELIGWDWRLVASVVYQESNFNPRVQSWAGAIGLMQVMPETGRYFGVRNLWDPNQNLKVGMKFLKFLDKHWEKTVPDPNERMKFVLASYNVGLSHVIDAQKLTRKYEKDPTLWEGNVEYYLLQKSNPKYFRDPIASVGYCRCDGPVNYVKEVLARYDGYKLRIAA